MLLLPTYSSYDDSTITDQLKFICLGCDESIYYDVLNKRILIDNNEYGNVFNITLLTLWQNKTEASITTLVEIL